MLAATFGCNQKVSVSELGLGFASTSVNATIFRGASVTSDGNYQIAAYYDSTGTIMLARRELNSNVWELAKTELTADCSDAHNTISVAIDGEGSIHISWGQHAVPLRYARSRKPYSYDFETIDVMVNEREEQDVTYPEFHRFSNGDLLFAYRQGRSGAGNLVLNRYDVKDREWTRVQTNLLDGEGERNAYWQMHVDTNDAIHISWVWRETEDVASNHDICYALSTDGGSTWHRSDGTLYQFPITLKTAEIAWHIPEASELINQTSMTTDKSGHPYIATYWRDSDSEVPQYRLVYHDDDGWHSIRVGRRKTAFSLSGPGTKSIPISRPQIVARKGKTTLIFRDAERGSKVTMATSRNLKHWKVRDLSDYSVDAWEPSLDYERWKRENVLDIFVQKVSQGDGEKELPTPPQPVCIFELR